MHQLLQSVLDRDNTPIVLCDLDHIIRYMNPKAIRHYANYGGEALIGHSLLDCHNAKSVEMICKIVDWFSKSKENNRIYTFRNAKENKDVYMIALRNQAGDLIGYYEKHEYRNIETAALYDFSKSLP